MTAVAAARMGTGSKSHCKNAGQDTWTAQVTNWIKANTAKAATVTYNQYSNSVRTWAAEAATVRRTWPLYIATINSAPMTYSATKTASQMTEMSTYAPWSRLQPVWYS